MRACLGIQNKASGTDTWWRLLFVRASISQFSPILSVNSLLTQQHSIIPQELWPPTSRPLFSSSYATFFVQLQLQRIRTPKTLRDGANRGRSSASVTMPGAGRISDPWSVSYFCLYEVPPRQPHKQADRPCDSHMKELRTGCKSPARPVIAFHSRFGY